MGDQVDDPERWRSDIIYGNFSICPPGLWRGNVVKVIWVSEEHPEGRLVALKGIGKFDDSKVKERFIREFKVWSAAYEHRHPNIVPLLGIYVEPKVIPGSKERLRMFVSPWYEDDHAQRFLGEPRNRHTSGNFCPADRLHLIIDVAKGLRHMHSVGLVHADLNPTNILIESVNNEVTRIRYRALISDFNQSRNTNRAGLTTSGDHGNGVYSSPEFGTSIEEEGGKIDKGSLPGDVWSFGATAHYLITTTDPCRCEGWGMDDGHHDQHCRVHKRDWMILMRHMNRYPHLPPLYGPLYDQLWGLFMDKCLRWSRTDRATMDIIVAGLASIEQRLNLPRCTCPHNDGCVTKLMHKDS